MVALTTSQSVEEAFETVRANPQFSRFPLFEGTDVGEKVDPAAFVGVVHTPAVLRDLDDLLDGTDDRRDVASPPTTVTADTVISEVIDQFQAEHSELALVLDAGGEVVGLVTASDAFEAITGDLGDPLDADG
jgi:CBS domain containing-hemolysin-like protein